MHSKKKKFIKELEKELKELIKKSGQTNQDIHADYIDYPTLKCRIDNPGSPHNDDDNWQMNKLIVVYLLQFNILKKQNRIRAARKSAAAADAAIASNNSIKSSATSFDSSTSMSNKVNKITASFKSATPTLSGHLSTLSLPSSNDNTRDSLITNCLSDQSLPYFSHSVNKITTRFDTDLSIIVDTQAASKHT
jgi:hypothetical protein